MANPMAKRNRGTSSGPIPNATILAGIKPGFSDEALFDAFKRRIMIW